MTPIKEDLQKEESEEGERPIPWELPILPLLTTAFFPGTIGALQIRKGHNQQLFKDYKEGLPVGLVIQRNPEVEQAKPQDLYRFGLWAKVLNQIYLSQNIIQVILQGCQRIEILEYVREEPYLIGRVRRLEEKDYEGYLIGAPPSDSPDIRDSINSLMVEALNRLDKLVALDPNVSNELLNIIKINLKGPGKLADLIADSMGFSLTDKQRLIETLDGQERIKRVIEFLDRELQYRQTEAEIHQQVQVQIEKQHREQYLRMQLATIRKELGECNGLEADLQKLRERVQEKDLPEPVRIAAVHELDRLSTVPITSAEGSVIRTYLDCILSLPWNETTLDNLNLRKASRILDEGHYGLEKVKERILEFLAVGKLKKDLKGPILCFVGPPGVGKTSLGQSIANALGRKFIRVSLGGVRDEAEIRGHRRTYVGALPGKIIQGLQRAASRNPLFMIDEIDKVSSDSRGDPYGALLEVLDPEQNRDFVDHYLDMPFDLSQVMFITTANVLYAIPSPVLDRIEVIELPGYIEEEKIEIAKRYLIPKEVQENGLRRNQVDLPEGSILRIIRDYTRELGLRNLERNIAAICRKVAKGIALGHRRTYRIDADEVPLYLGPVKYLPLVAQKSDEVGVATGLAWTPVGGDILFVEAIKMQGHGRIQLTGKLGEVMRESAQAALSYVRSRAHSLAIPQDSFDNVDIHIHLPEGAIPKDGPSAGIALAVAIASLMSERPIRHDVAMTGEITLRGKVLPVGGLKEKILAAYTAGIPTVILPAGNEKDLGEIPPGVRKKVKLVPIENLQEAFDYAIHDLVLAQSIPSDPDHLQMILV